jgi:2-dehydro-3-deoxygluconokinase
VSEPFDLIAVGETMLSLIAVDGNLGTATSFRATHGGAESNTCVGAVRLGLSTAWVSRLSIDPLGDRIVSALAAEGVDVRWVVRDPDRPTGLMVRDTTGAPARYDRAGSSASALEPADLDGVPIEEARAVLVTGVTALIGEGPQRTAVALLERARGLRVVDPNLRLGLWGSARAGELILPLIERADLVLGGESELASLMGEGHGVELARRCSTLGPSEVVLKRGPAGAAVLDARGAWYEHPGSPVPNVDPVGAGDAFNAGYIAARLAGAPSPEALAQGAACGAQAASTFGDTGVLFDVDDLDAATIGRSSAQPAETEEEARGT